MTKPPLPPHTGRRHARRVALAALVALTACATPLPAPPMLYLSSAPPDGLPPVVAEGPASAAPLDEWRLVMPVTLPAALDRESVMVATAAGQWVPWQGLRWAEPLRDAVPRVLAADLTALRGAPVRAGRPVPGVRPPWALRIDIDDWEASLHLAELRLHAHWVLSAPDGSAATLRGTVTVRQPWPTATPQGLVQAQRAALRALATQVARQATPAATASPP